MIEKFRSEALKVAMVGDNSKLMPQVVRRIVGVWAVLDAAESLEDVQPLSGFHALQGDQEGEFAVTITRNWRITFTPIQVKKRGRQDGIPHHAGGLRGLSLSPPHAGAILRELYLPRTGVTLTALAARIGVSRRSVSMIVNETRPVTVDMAHRLARAFGTSSRFWLNLQRNVDDWKVFHERRGEYERITRLAA